MTIDKKLLEIIACPICKGKVLLDKENQELICKLDRVAFPVRNHIPVMLENEARDMTLEEVEKWHS
ncbi:Trm112 family protein [Algicola sagamiensis]|uniref:Trm112 family protein n=1 Tax=Algicola sagamiensis TaxID=163869 RepID=UPI000374E83C|nr:Trm112 family protein [Algicola sagamiensis]